MQRLAAVALTSILVTPVASHAVEPVLLAPVVAGNADDQPLAAELERRVRDRLVADGLVVIDDAVIGDAIPAEELSRCADVPLECAVTVVPELPVRIAVMARVDRVGDANLGHIEVVGPGAQRPLATVDVAVTSENAHLFAEEVSRVVSATLSPMDEPPPDLMVRAAALLAPPPPFAPEPEPSAAGSSPSRAGPVEVGVSGVPPRRFAGARERLARSGQHPRDFLFRSTPHAGQAIVELRAGVGMGDVDRQVLFRDELRDDVLVDQWYREAPASGIDFLGAGYVGYAPLSALDFGVLVGFQYSSRVVNAQTLRLEGPGDTPQRDEPQLSLVQAIDVVFQPRIRLYAVSLGPAKPYVVLGGEAKVFQGYQVPEGDPAPPGGWIPGAVAGAGIVIDPGPIVGLFAEGSYTLHFGDRTAEVTSSVNGAWPWVSSEPPLSENLGGTVTVTGGVQFRL